MNNITEEKILLLIDDRIDKKFKECEKSDIANEKRKTDEEKAEKRQDRILNAISELKKDMQMWTLKVMGGLIVGTGGLVVTILKIFPNVIHLSS